MDTVVERAAGLDVHKDRVVVTTLIAPAGKRPRRQTRTFGTFLPELRELLAWLLEQGITAAAMESTGPYWLPVYSALEGAGIELVVGNAQHIKNVPGRKTDVGDSEWLARLLRSGLIRKSFVPERTLRELRDLLRCRRSLVDVRTDERNRILKLLESASIKLDTVVSDTFGVSGMAILRALAAGASDPKALADLARGAMRKKLERLQLALEGRFTAHHQLMLRLGLTGLDDVERRIGALEDEIERRMEPYQAQINKLCEIPGIGATTASIIVAEIGVDMTVFGTAQRLSAWAGLCPGNNESAGKRLGGSGARTRKGNVFLKTAMVEAAQGAVNKKSSALRAKFYRLKARRGFKTALVAIAHKLIQIVFKLLSDPNARYTEVVDLDLDQRNKDKAADKLVRRLERLGYSVSVAAARPTTG